MHGRVKGPSIALVLVAAVAPAVGCGNDSGPPPAPAPPPVRLHASAYMGPQHRLYVTWRTTSGDAPATQVRVRREDGGWQAGDVVSGGVVILPRTHVGEHVVLQVTERDGRRAGARLRVRPATRVELCRPTTGPGAYPSYCAPEDAAQDG